MLDVEIVGEGPDLVLLHSLLADRGSFAPLVERWRHSRRLIVVDLPGFGGSPPAEPLAGYADAVVETIAALGLSGPVDLLGNGLGGFVALLAAARPVANVARLVLVGSAVAFPEEGRAVFRAMAKNANENGMLALADAAVSRLFPADFIAANPALAAARKTAFLKLDRAVFVNACNALATLDLTGMLPAVRQPVLVVTGQHDGATPPALGRKLAEKLADARFVELAGLAHAPQMQDPDAFAAATAPFLAIR